MSRSEKGYLRRLAEWIDERVGFTKTILRPQPRYSLHPLYWLGALAFTAFILQGFIGMILLQHYRPTVEEAYESVVYIRSMIPFGLLLTTMHLYGAYAMVILALLHLIRGYFLKQYRSPRELMWIVGVLMGLTTLALSFTGYLLPWTVISKSATDVSIGLLMNLPEPLNIWIKTIISGLGSDQELLTRFFAFHVVILPAILVLLFAVKLHMFEVHGVSEPLRRRFMKDILDYEKEAEEKANWFPEIALYFLILATSYISALLLVSALFPSELPPKYTPEEAARLLPQPEWYFLWMYQVLKIEIFEGPIGVRAALGLFTVIALVLLFLPLIDRSKAIDIWDRPIQVTVGVVALVDSIILSVWGYLTPGVTIKLIDALVVLGVPTVAIVGAMYALYRRANRIRRGEVVMLYEKFIRPSYAKYFIESFTFSLLVLFSSALLATLVRGCTTATFSALTSLSLLVLFVSSLTLTIKRFILDYISVLLKFNTKPGVRG